jgi:DNA-binding NarL/FixJ family response regulator
MANPIRVVIADDHPIVRGGIRAAVESVVTVVGEVADGRSAVSMIEELAPDIALLDMEMPGQDGLDACREIQVICPQTKIVFLTVHKEGSLFRAAIATGASGYLLKDDSPETILECLNAVASGRHYYSPSLTTSIAQELSSTEEDPLSYLTSTERHIVAMIASGKTSKEIGQSLSLHHRTIENHRTNICRKLNLNGPSALLRFALQYRKTTSHI